METNNLFNNLIQRNQSAAFSSGKVRPNHETNINIIARRTGKDVNSHTVLDGIITTIMATIQRINIIGSREGSRNLPNELNQDDARYGFRCCHLKNIWTAPLPPETELSRQMTTSTTSIDIMGLQAAYANLHTDQERDYFMQRYHDVISSFGGKTSY